MRKLFGFFLLALFVTTNIFGSCEDKEILDKKIKKSKAYFSEQKICSNIDSVETGIRILTGEVNGHKVMYHLFNGKNKGQMEVWHLTNECKKCKSK